MISTSAFSLSLEENRECLRSSPTRGAPEPGGAGGLCILQQGRAPPVPSSLPPGRLPAARLPRPPHAVPGRGRPRAGAVLPDPGGAADQPGEQQEDGDPVSYSCVLITKLHISFSPCDAGSDRFGWTGECKREATGFLSGM